MYCVPWHASWVVCLVGVAFFRWYTNPLRSIPTIGGPSLPVVSILGALYFVRHSKTLLEDGCKKYHESCFKIPLLDKWVVVVCGPKMIEDVRKRPDDELSTYEGIREFSQTTYTASPEMLQDTGHESSTIIKENLTRGIPSFTPNIAKEVQSALQEYISGGEGDWVNMNAWCLMRNITTRSASLVFVGFPLCRDVKYLAIVYQYLADFKKAVVTMSVIPKFLKPILGSRVSKVPKHVAAALSLLGPAIEERKHLMEEHGREWHGKPNDMLQWILDRAIRKEKSNYYVLERFLGLNFAAISSTTDTLTHILHHLAAFPETHGALRSEVEAVVSSEGWTAASLNKMTKLDSFMKESQRCTSIGLMSLMKKAMKDVQLSDGTFIPKGTLLVAAHSSMHHNATYYPDPDVFDPFRFSHMREEDGDLIKHQYTTTSVAYLPWGYGVHACPGRFFAVMEMKVIVANILIHYDLKLGGDGRRPKETYVAFSVQPSRDSMVLFRKRRSGWLSSAL